MKHNFKFLPLISFITIYLKKKSDYILKYFPHNSIY